MKINVGLKQFARWSGVQQQEVTFPDRRARTSETRAQRNDSTANGRSGETAPLSACLPDDAVYRASRCCTDFSAGDAGGGTSPLGSEEGVDMSVSVAGVDAPR